MLWDSDTILHIEIMELNDRIDERQSKDDNLPHFSWDLTNSCLYKDTDAASNKCDLENVKLLAGWVFKYLSCLDNRIRAKNQLYRTKRYENFKPLYTCMLDLRFIKL